VFRGLFFLLGCLLFLIAGFVCSQQLPFEGNYYFFFFLPAFLAFFLVAMVSSLEG
jgi:hypothetical protein